MPTFNRDTPHEVVQEHLRRALSGGRIIVWEWEPVTGIAKRSGNVLEVLGCDPSTSLDFNACIHPADRPQHQRALQSAATENQPFDIEVRFIRPDGSTIWLQIRGEPHVDAEGRRFVSGINVDITGRKQAEGEAHALAQLLSTTLENMDQGLIMVDPEGIVQVCSRRTVELLDLPAHYTTAKPSFGEFVAYQHATGEFAGAIDGVTPWLKLRGDLLGAPPIYERTRPNGVVLEIRTVHLANGGAVRTFTDVTARKAADSALLESERQYRLLAENTADMIVLTNKDRMRRYVSPASYDILGYSPEELLEISSPSQTHPDDVERVSSNFYDIFSQRISGASVITYRMRHKEGHWVPVEARRRLILDERGQPEAVLSAVRDISERVKLEEQLRQAQKMEAIGQLTGGIAHDFNNLMTIIMGNAELLVEAPSDPAATQSLAEMILQAAEKGSDLTHRLLAFGRRQTFKPERLDLDQVVERMGPLLRRTISTTIEIAFEVQPTDLAALTDRTLLESAILNLVVNARDAMPHGGSLRIVTGERIATVNDGSIPAGQPVVFVSITDTGVGMSRDVLDRAFEPFYSTKAIGKGSGLGLPMVYGFAEQAGGHVSIASAVGQGTTVTILLPAISKVSMQAAEVADVEEAQGNGERVLVVEDEPQVRHFVCSQLSALGYEIEAVAAGPDALAVLREDPDFDLLFTDVVMPKGMSGIELAKHARGIKPTLRVLLTSGYPEDAFQEHGVRTADMPLLRKPYKRMDLAEAIRRALG